MRLDVTSTELLTPVVRAGKSRPFRSRDVTESAVRSILSAGEDAGLVAELTIRDELARAAHLPRKLIARVITERGTKP